MTADFGRICFAVLFLSLCLPAAAQQAASVSISVKNHRFQPAEIHAPANVPIELHVKNLDPTPMEFESVSLRVEKVVTGNSEGVIRLRPLSPGTYNSSTISIRKPPASWWCASALHQKWNQRRHFSAVTRIGIAKLLGHETFLD